MDADIAAWRAINKIVAARRLAEAPLPEVYVEAALEAFIPEDLDALFGQEEEEEEEEVAEPPAKRARKEKCPQAINMDTVVWHTEYRAGIIPVLPRCQANTKISNDQNRARSEAMDELRNQIYERELEGPFAAISDPQPVRHAFRLGSKRESKGPNRKAADVYQRMFFSWNKSQYAKMKRVLGIDPGDEFEAL